MRGACELLFPNIVGEKAMQIYAGNLPESMSEEELKALFTPYGTVKNVNIGKDKKSGESEGYGFIEMPVKSEARKAIDALRGKEIEGKPLRVKALKPGDDFLQHAVSLQGGGGRGPAQLPGKPSMGNQNVRGSGAIRRGGKRGS